MLQEVRKVFFENFIVNTSLIGTPRQEKAKAEQKEETKPVETKEISAETTKEVTE